MLDDAHLWRRCRLSGVQFWNRVFANERRGSRASREASSPTYEFQKRLGSSSPFSRRSLVRVRSLDGDAVRARRTGGERRIEIEIEAWIEHQVVFSHPRHVDLVVALGVHLAEIVFVQKMEVPASPHKEGSPAQSSPHQATAPQLGALDAYAMAEMSMDPERLRHR